MISVITSVYRKEVYDRFSRNVADTIGVPYELIGIDNSKGEMGLCEVYNKAARQARYDILCFAHEDIHIHTSNWGEKIVQRFGDDSRLGLLGVVGTLYKTYSPNGWGVSWEWSRANFIQHHNHSGEPVLVRSVNPQNETVSRVACVDGLWLCTPKKIALETGFDESTFRGFHCYDLDYSLSVRQKYDVGVTYDLQIEHFSEGSPDRSWISDTIKLHRKWRAVLPAMIGEISPDTKRQFEKDALDNFIHRMRNFRFGFFSIAKVLYLNTRNPVIQDYAKQWMIRLIKEQIKFRVLRFQWFKKPVSPKS